MVSIAIFIFSIVIELVKTGIVKITFPIPLIVVLDENILYFPKIDSIISDVPSHYSPSGIPFVSSFKKFERFPVILFKRTEVFSIAFIFS